jgi:RhtB (resistance to homoserine/threonine) family protein
MFGIHDFPLFIVSGILLNLTPGQDTMYIIGRSMAQGRRAGIISALGIMTGVLVHTLLAALGLSVILATSSLAFSIVKYAGAGYLIWIGIGFLINRNENPAMPVEEAETRKSGKLFRQGVLTNLLNPKVALFFLSFLPQFVSPRAQPVFLPFLILGLVLFTTGSIWCIFLAIGSAWLAERTQKYNSVGGLAKIITGVLFVALGIRLAFSKAA